jgi:hypothetical protein
MNLREVDCENGTRSDEIWSPANTVSVLLIYGKDYGKTDCSHGGELWYVKKRSGQYPVVVWGSATRVP